MDGFGYGIRENALMIWGGITSVMARTGDAVAEEETTGQSELEGPVIFFDGVCVMCNRFVDLVLSHDDRDRFRFAPIQGETAEEHLPPLEEDPSEWSIVYLDENGVQTGSDASLEIYRQIGFPWCVIGWMKLIPRFLREPVYRWIARNRYRFFGQKDSCRIPPEDEQHRFLP